MRILIFVTRLSGGGAERVATLWANGFVSRGHEVGMVVRCQHTDRSFPLSDQVTVINIWSNLGRLFQKYLRINTAPIRSIRQAINQFQPDVAICVLQPWGEWVLKASKGLRLPIINTEHSTWEKPDNAVYGQLTSQRLYWRYELNQQFDCVTVLTEADKQCAEGTLSNVVVMPNPLAFTPVTSVPPKKHVMLAAGRLDVWHCKGFDLLLEAWGAIAKDRPDWKLVIGGLDSHGAQKYLMSIVREKQIEDQVEFPGYQEDMQPLYQSASIFVLSSRYEGFGMVLIEAMSQGCAPIACDYKGRQQEIITTENEGLLCPPEDPAALSQAMARMIDDEDYRKKVQEHAIDRSKHFSLDRIMDKWETIFKQINENRDH